MFRLLPYAFRASHPAIKRSFLSSSKNSVLGDYLVTLLLSKDVRMYLSDAYQAFDKWDESLSNEILQKTNISTYEKIANEIK